MINNDLIVKSNSLIEASYSLSVVEFRLLQIVFAEVSKYEDSFGVMPNHEFRIHAEEYARIFDVDKNTAYEALRDASKRLFDRYFTYERIYWLPDKVEIVNSRWVQKVAYSSLSGHIMIQLTSDVIEMIGKLKSCFTQYKIKQICNLTSIYALRLYELTIQWLSTRKTPVFETDEFREKLGLLKNEYTRMSNFKARVLEPAIEQINANTDINLKYHQHKKGRVITGFSFTVIAKKKKSIVQDKVAEISNKMTDTEDKKERRKITKSQAELLARPGETWADLLKRISKDYIVKDLD